MILFIIALLLLWVSIFHTQKDTLMNMDEVHGKGKSIVCSQVLPGYLSLAAQQHYTITPCLVSCFSYTPPKIHSYKTYSHREAL
jgi:hypothetical protein